MTKQADDERYSAAQRCTACDRRAILGRRVADRFVECSHGKLVTSACPDGHGWHLFNPGVERGRHTVTR